MTTNSGEGKQVMSDREIAPVLYRVEEAAEALRVSRSVIYELIRSEQLRTIKVGRSRRVPVEALADCVALLMGEAA
jgi:excisionase family DNA binding protein